MAKHKNEPAESEDEETGILTAPEQPKPESPPAPVDLRIRTRAATERPEAARIYDVSGGRLTAPVTLLALDETDAIGHFIPQGQSMSGTAPWHAKCVNPPPPPPQMQQVIQVIPVSHPK